MNTELSPFTRLYKNLFDHLNYRNVIDKISHKNKLKKDASETIHRLTHTCQLKEEQIYVLSQACQVKDSQLHELAQACQVKDSQLRELAQACQVKDGQLRELAQTCENKDSEYIKLLDFHRQADDDRIKLTEECSRLNEEKWRADRQETAIEFLTSFILKLQENKLNEMDRFRYDDFYAMIEGGGEKNTEAYKAIIEVIYKNNIRRLKDKAVIKVVFIVTNASIWTCDAIYKKLSRDSRFHVCVIVIPFEYGNEREIILKTYNDTCDFFNSNGYNFIRGYNIKSAEYLSFEQTINPDIVFHLSPHMQYIHKNYKVESMPLSVLNIYIPYGIMTVNGYSFQFNQKSHHLFWKIFCETPLHQKMAREHSLFKDFNIVCSGYVKMDPFLNGSPVPDHKTIWKFSSSHADNEIIKIIWAPHHALMDNETAFGTFHRNYRFFYELAKKMPNTSWIVKPHPLLKIDSIQFGLFKNQEEYDEYMEQWDALPNARTVHEGSYVDIFKTSDAMILDSVSFLAEYLFVNKPSLFLTRKGNTFNDFGMLLKECHYQVDGSDLVGIENFITEVLIRKNDTKKQQREDFFNKYLNYLHFNDGILASDYIYKYLVDTFAME